MASRAFRNRGQKASAYLLFPYSAPRHIPGTRAHVPPSTSVSPSVSRGRDTSKVNMTLRHNFRGVPSADGHRLGVGDTPLPPAYLGQEIHCYKVPRGPHITASHSEVVIGVDDEARDDMTLIMIGHVSLVGRSIKSTSLFLVASEPVRAIVRPST